MKKIIITGKHNIDKLQNPKNAIRTPTKNIQDDDLVEKKQVRMLNQLFLGDSFQHKDLMLREIQKKINSYKQQDLIKEIYNKT